MKLQNTDRTAARLLQKLEPGELPPETFLEIARLVVMPIVEVVPLRLHEGVVQVLLLPRPPDDPVWGGQVHTPGTVIRPSDHSVADALDRLIARELEGVETSAPVFVEHQLHRQKRGMELALVYWVEVRGEPGEGSFHELVRMPPNLVTTQLDFIHPACQHFLSSHGPAPRG